MLVDSHCHLDLISKSTGESVDDIVDCASRLGVSHILQISTSPQNFGASLNFANAFENVFCSIGVHPLYLEREEAVSPSSSSANPIDANVQSTVHSDNLRSSIIHFDALSDWLNHDKVVAIGETGFDFYRISDSSNSPNSGKKQAYKIQRKNLEVHVAAAQKYDLPLIVHTRSADEETIDFLTNCYKQKSFRGVIHCFTATERLAFKMLDIGFYISASGVVTFKNAEEIRSTIAKVPSDMLLVETDAPYLAPSPLRGKTNRPENVMHTAKFLAKLRNEGYEEFCMNSTNNFFTLFNKANK